MPLPPSPSDLTKYPTQDYLPTSLNNFLVWLIVGDQESKDPLTLDERINVPSDADHRRVVSLGQDLIHAVSHGRLKTPKHVALPMAVKQLTGSGQVLTLFNRFGHASSLSKIDEIEASMAEKVLQQVGQAYVPTSICQGGHFVHFCWDNNNLNEDTLSGANTTHCTNGILIQRKVQLDQ